MKKGKSTFLVALMSASLLTAPQYMQAFAEEGEESYQITGTVFQYAFDASETSGTPKDGKTVKVTLKEGSVSLVSENGGKIKKNLSDAERTDDGKYSYSVDKTEEHYAASGTLEEGTEESPSEGSIYIRERYEAKASDYEFEDAEGVKKIGSVTWVRSAGTYDIKPTSGMSLSSSLDGEKKDTLSVSVSANGTINPFYVYNGDYCSKVLSDQKVKVDSGAPTIESVETKAANDSTFVKEHGIYGKDKAEIAINADITEDTEISEAYILVEKNGVETRYDASKLGAENSKFEAVIGLPDGESIRNADLAKLVVVDAFGNASEAALLAKTEAGSKITLEKTAPVITKSESGKKSSYGWYSEMPTFTANAEDALSGLSSLSISGEGFDIASEEYSEKVTSRKTVTGHASFGDESSSGAYKYTAYAVDNAGNEAKSDFNVKIDLVKPSLSVSGVKNGVHYRKNPVITIEEDEKYYKEEGNRIYLKITRGGKSLLNNVYTKGNALTVPASIFNADGNYTVEIYAKDAADNESEKHRYSFTKDATSPKLTITGVKSGAFYNKKQTVSIKVVERNYKTNSVSTSAVRKLGGTHNIGFPWKNKGVTSVNSKTFSDTGTYTVTASAKDKAGNSSGTKSVSFTVDTRAPEITITGVQDKGVYTYGQGVAPKVSVKDDYPASQSITYTKGGQVIARPDFSQVKENDGLYTMTVTATDKAGNTTRREISFTVNRFGSYFVYGDSVKAVMGQALQNVEGDLTITEKNVSKVTKSEPKVYLDGKLIDTKGRTEADEGSAEKTYKHIFSQENFDTEGAYELNVVSKDEAGNEMESKEENGPVRFYVDRTAPSLSLSGIDPKGNKAESITATVNASDTLTGVASIEAFIDGEEVATTKNEETGEVTFEIGKGLRQEITVKARDGAGNEAVYEDTASVSQNALSLFFSRAWKAVAGVAAAILAALGGLLFFAKKKKKEE